MTATLTLTIVLFALFCCGMALYVVVADRNWRPTVLERPDRLAGMTPDALDVVRQANRRPA